MSRSKSPIRKILVGKPRVGRGGCQLELSGGRKNESGDETGRRMPLVEHSIRLAYVLDAPTADVEDDEDDEDEDCTQRDYHQINAVGQINVSILVAMGDAALKDSVLCDVVMTFCGDVVGC